jgi:hypothetical protein
MRAHYRAPVQDAAGDLLPGAVISVYVNGTTSPPNGAGTLISGPVYSDGSSLLTLTNPWTTPDGNISFYLATAQRVDLGIQPSGGVLTIWPDIDVNINQASSAQLTFPGSGTSSTAVGNNATATNTQAVAFGDTSSASGQQSTADGQQASASGQQSVAVGQLAGSTGPGSTAVGQAASASGAQSVALGAGTGAVGNNATALGAGASAPGSGSTALGSGAQATLPNQVVLGTLAADVSIPGGLEVGQGLAQVLVNGSTILATGTLSVPVSAAGAITGLILSLTGVVGGQLLLVNNESAFTLTFAVAGTSNVADGTSCQIAALSARWFVYDGNTSLWYPVAGGTV